MLSFAQKGDFLENPAAIENLQEFTNYNITHKSF
jgi:hypothetical protein